MLLCASVHTNKRRPDAMQGFKPNDGVFILPQYAHLYPANRGVICSVSADRFRSLFNEYTVQFPDGSKASVLEFQLIEALPDYQTWIADITFDSRFQVAETSVRGKTSSIQIVFQANDFDVDLKFRSDQPARASILGQVLERNSEIRLAGLELRLMREGTAIATTVSDGSGLFEFSSVPAGSLNLVVLIPQHHLRILGTFSI
jgi:hypothetical protein